MRQLPELQLSRQARLSADVLPGWIPIVEELDRQLAELDPDYRLLQVKEKFGGLRYYVESEEFPYSEESPFHRAISEAEARCARTCEVCGSPGEIELSGKTWTWLKCLCDRCRDQWNTGRRPWDDEWED